MTQTDDVIVNLNEEKMHDLMVKEVTIGCEEYPSVKAGIVGEVGSSWPIDGKRENEKLLMTPGLKVSRKFHRV